MAKLKRMNAMRYELELSPMEVVLLTKDAEKSDCSVENCIAVYLERRLEQLLHDMA